jgi:hypothetical protein
LLNKTHGFWVGRLKRLKSVQKLHPKWIVHFLILTKKPERALLQRNLARYVQWDSRAFRVVDFLTTRPLPACSLASRESETTMLLGWKKGSPWRPRISALRYASFATSFKRPLADEKEER